MSGSAVKDLRNTYGVAFIGLSISTILYGVSVTQTWIYYWNYRTRDPMALKAFVAILFILDTLHAILCIHEIYWYLILNFGNVENLGYCLWSFNVQICLNGGIGYLVQLFYARRVYILSNRLIVPAIVAVLGGITFALGIMYTIRLFQFGQSSRVSSLRWVGWAGMGPDALADIIIAMSMCWYLYHKRTGFSQTDSMISILMAFSINSGLLTSILAVATLVSFVVAPLDLYWELFFWMVGRCYVNSFLAMLNNRDSLRERFSGDDPSSVFQMESIRKSRMVFNPRARTTAVSVTMDSAATTEFATNMRAYDANTAMHGSDKSEGMISSAQHESSVSGSVV